MARTKRQRNKSRNAQTEELKAALERDPNNVLAFIPDNFISRRTANRKYKLTEAELQGLDKVAVVGERQGQQGIFYPVGDVRVFAESKENINEDNFISVTSVKRQLKGQSTYLERIEGQERKTKIRGKIGNYFQKDILKAELGITVLSGEEKYIPSRKVPVAIQSQYPRPVPCIWNPISAGPGKIQDCFLGHEVHDLGNTLSRRSQEDSQNSKSRPMMLGDTGPPGSPVLKMPSGIESGGMGIGGGTMMGTMGGPVEAVE